MNKLLTLILSLGYLFPVFSQTEDKDAIIASLQNEVRELTRKNEVLKEELIKLKSNSYNQNGVEYRVQLGIQNPDNPIYSLSKPKKMSGTTVNGKLVYDIGGFSNPDDAYNLSQEMRKLNLSGSFVTKYINGERDYSFRYSGNADSYMNSTSSSNKVPNAMKSTISTGDDINIGTVKMPEKSKVMYIEE